MKGKVFAFDRENRQGMIVDKNNNILGFHIGEWLSDESIIIGKEVEFDIPIEEAINIRTRERGNFFKRIFRRKIGDAIE